jgi:hypothetical protein
VKTIDLSKFKVGAFRFWQFGHLVSKADHPAVLPLNSAPSLTIPTNSVRRRRPRAAGGSAGQSRPELHKKPHFLSGLTGHENVASPRFKLHLLIVQPNSRTCLVFYQAEAIQLRCYAGGGRQRPVIEAVRTLRLSQNGKR